jgi:DNA-binding response OmpR family regulator
MNPMRMPDDWVYVVDDDSSMREALSSLARSRGWHVRTFESARAFLEHPRPKAPSCLILDVQLPGLTGPELHQQLQQTRDGIPIIYLTGNGDVPGAVRAMKAGAVEFLTKPFDQQTLLRAIQQCLARRPAARTGPDQAPRVLEFEPFRLDIAEQCLWRYAAMQRERILLTPKALAVLCYLAERPGRVVSEQELLEALWHNVCVQPEAVKTQLCEIRKALGDNPRAPRFIETLHRRGYRFIETVRSGPAPNDAAQTSLEVPKRLPGRDSGLAVLLEHLGSALRGQRQFVFVAGDLGMGKTALMDEFQRAAVIETPGLCVARGHCIKGEGGREVYYPLLEALECLCRQSARILEAVAAHAPTWLAQLPGLLTDVHRRTLQQEILGATRNRMFRELVQTLEMVCTGQALAIVLEDLQWADGPTLDLLATLARGRGPARLMLVGTARPVESSADAHSLPLLLSDLVARGLCQPVELEPLTVGDIVAWLSEGSPEEGQFEPVAQSLQRLSGGNPLFLRAVLAQLSDLEIAVHTRRGWTFRAPLPVALPVPESVATLIEAQLQRLTPRERLALGAAGRVGLRFTVAEAARVAAIDSNELRALFDGLVRSKLFLSRERAQGSPGDEPDYAFVNPLYHKIISGQNAP